MSPAEEATKLVPMVLAEKGKRLSLPPKLV
jgi:hypothetical protein